MQGILPPAVNAGIACAPALQSPGLDIYCPTSRPISPQRYKGAYHVQGAVPLLSAIGWVRESHVGRAVRCPKCRGVFRVGNPDAAEVEGGAAATGASYYEVEESSGASPRVIALSISGAILAAAVFIIFIYAVTLQSRGGSSPEASRPISDNSRARNAERLAEARKAAEAMAEIAAYLFVVALFACNIALMIWVVKDARNRGDDNGVLWMIVVVTAGIIGLIIYLAARRPGSLVTCDNCHNRRLHYTTACPHCGIRAPAPAT
jgi:hypothetical protein